MMYFCKRIKRIYQLEKSITLTLSTVFMAVSAFFCSCFPVVFDLTSKLLHNFILHDSFIIIPIKTNELHFWND